MTMTALQMQQAEELETLLAEEELSADARERLQEMVDQLRLGRLLEELIPPNIRSDEPIPGHHKGADAARAQSPTGDLPRTDIAAPKPPEEMKATHQFARPVRRSRPSVADLNPGQDAEAAAGEAHDRALVTQGARRFHPQLPDVESAMPYEDQRNEL
jgi:hypothetical protein